MSYCQYLLSLIGNHLLACTTSTQQRLCFWLVLGQHLVWKLILVLVRSAPGGLFQREGSVINLCALFG